MSGFKKRKKIGYKKGIIYGLVISVIGALALALISTSANPTFGMVLVAFFIIALGFSLQQTAAQPFAIALGSPETGAHRLNMAGGVTFLPTLRGPCGCCFSLFSGATTTTHT